MRNPFHHGSFVTVFDGGKNVTLRVDIEIDLDEVARIYGSKAASNKSRRTKQLGGLIVVKVTEG